MHLNNRMSDLQLSIGLSIVTDWIPMDAPVNSIVSFNSSLSTLSSASSIRPVTTRWHSDSRVFLKKSSFWIADVLRRHTSSPQRMQQYWWNRIRCDSTQGILGDMIEAASRVSSINILQRRIANKKFVQLHRFSSFPCPQSPRFATWKVMIRWSWSRLRGGQSEARRIR